MGGKFKFELRLVVGNERTMSWTMSVAQAAHSICERSSGGADLICSRIIIVQDR